MTSFTWQEVYRKIPKNLDSRKICCNHPKIRTKWLYNWEMCPKDVGGIANSVDPDETASVWSGSTLFAQTCLSENLGTLRYFWVLSCWIFLFSLSSYGLQTDEKSVEIGISSMINYTPQPLHNMIYYNTVLDSIRLSSRHKRYKQFFPYTVKVTRFWTRKKCYEKVLVY